MVFYFLHIYLLYHSHGKGGCGKLHLLVLCYEPDHVVRRIDDFILVPEQSIDIFLAVVLDQLLVKQGTLPPSVDIARIALDSQVSQVVSKKSTARGRGDEVPRVGPGSLQDGPSARVAGKGAVPVAVPLSGQFLAKFPEDFFQLCGGLLLRFLGKCGHASLCNKICNSIRVDSSL